MAEATIGKASDADKALLADPSRFQEKIARERKAYTKANVERVWYKAITYGDGKEKGLEFTKYKNGNTKCRLAWLAKKGIVTRGNKPKDFGG